MSKNFKDIFSQLDCDVSNGLTHKYRGETDIVKVLDTSYLKDDLGGLIEEITKQPAVYAYWANLRRIADEKYDDIERKFEVVKTRYYTMALQELRSHGIKTPTQKQVEAKFTEINADAEWYKEFMKHMMIWNKRKKVLAILEKAIAARGDSFRSLSYLMSNMMNHGLYQNSNSQNRRSTNGKEGI